MPHGWKRLHWRPPYVARLAEPELQQKWQLWCDVEQLSPAELELQSAAIPATGSEMRKAQTGQQAREVSLPVLQLSAVPQ